MRKHLKSLWKNDVELFALARQELFTAVVGDIMDQAGYLHQFLPPQIRPLREDMVIIGRALPVLEADVTRKQKKPFGRMLEALDDLKPREIYVCSGATPAYALWGELMSTRAQMLGAGGAVLNGYTRDARGTIAMNFPVFSWGTYAQDQRPRGRVVDFRVPIKIGQVSVSPGDIVFGDLDGVCIVPASVEGDIFRRALEKARGEKTVKMAIQRGMSAKRVFDKYGIL